MTALFDFWAGLPGSRMTFMSTLPLQIDQGLCFRERVLGMVYVSNEHNLQ